MGPFSTAVAIGCLSALRWLFWLTALLMAALIVKQLMSGEGVASGLFAAAPAFAALGWLSGWAARKIAKSNGG